MKKRILFVLLVLALLAVAAGVAYAAIPDSNGEVHACYRNTTGEVRVTDSSCYTDETGLVLNSVGGYEVVTLGDAENNGNAYHDTYYPGTWTNQVYCPSGKIALSGGIEIYGADSGNAVLSSYPHTYSGSNGWAFKWRDFPANSGEIVNIYVVCADG